jgi:hypothetical protein
MQRSSSGPDLIVNRDTVIHSRQESGENVKLSTIILIPEGSKQEAQGPGAQLTSRQS